MPNNKESLYSKDWIEKAKKDEIDEALRKAVELVKKIDAEVE